MRHTLGTRITAALCVIVVVTGIRLYCIKKLLPGIQQSICLWIVYRINNLIKATQHIHQVFLFTNKGRESISYGVLEDGIQESLIV